MRAVNWGAGTACAVQLVCASWIMPHSRGGRAGVNQREVSIPPRGFLEKGQEGYERMQRRP